MINFINNFYLKHNEIIHNFKWRALQICGKQGMIFLIFIFCAKLLSPVGFGTYNYVMAIVMLLVMFGDFGISTATSKYVAEYNVTDKDKLKAVLFNSGIIIFGLTVILTAITLVFGQQYLGKYYVYVLYLLPIVFLSPVSSLYDGIYRGLKRFKQISIISTVTGLISLSSTFFLVKEYGIVGALLTQDIFYLLLVVGSFLFYKEFHLKINKIVIKEIGKYSIAFGVATMGYYFFSELDILILGHFGYIKEIATYELLNKIFAIALVPFAIIGQIISPDFTVMYVKKEFLRLKASYKQYLKNVAILSVLVSGVMFLALPIIFKLFFSNYYNNIFSAVFGLVVAIYALNFFNSPINAGIIVATGHAKLMTYMNILLAFFNFIICIIMIHLLGYIGVIYGTLFSSIIGTVILQVRFYFIMKNLDYHV